MNTRVITVILFLFPLLGCMTTPPQTVHNNPPYTKVSMLNLLVHTERHHQRDFIIDGYLVDGYLYFSPEQAKHQDTSYAIAIRTNENQPFDLASFNEQWVFINGRLAYEDDPRSFAGSSVLVVQEISSSF